MHSRSSGALLHVLLALEEAGKLIQIIQSAAETEAKPGEMYVVVEGFRDHSTKALKTAKYLERIFVFLFSVFKQVELEDSDDFVGTYTDHLSSLGADFERLREGTMYVDYDGGEWNFGRPVSERAILIDIGAVGVLTDVIEHSLKNHSTFSEVVNDLVEKERTAQRELPQKVQELKAAMKRQ